VYDLCSTNKLALPLFLAFYYLFVTQTSNHAHSRVWLYHTSIGISIKQHACLEKSGPAATSITFDKVIECQSASLIRSHEIYSSLARAGLG